MSRPPRFVTMKPLDERESLTGWLDRQRAILVSKVQGLDAEALAFSPVGTGTSLGGLIRHVCVVEHYWFQRTFLGQPSPDRWSDPWKRRDDFSGPQLITTFEDICATNRQIELEATSLDQLAVGSVSWARGAHPTLRWIMNHLIEEEARHNGHADLLRELVDGVVGL